MSEKKTNIRIKIGVLAVQGAFAEHRQILEKLGVETFEIRQLRDLEQDFDGLILPGGESTVQGKLCTTSDFSNLYANASKADSRHSGLAQASFYLPRN